MIATSIPTGANLGSHGHEITISEATRLLGHATSDYLYKLLRSGRIPAIKYGKVWRVTREAVERYKQERGER